MREEVGRFLLELGHEEAVQLAIERKLLLAPVSTVKDLVESPHEAARDFFDVAKGSDGAPVTLPGPFAMTEAPGFMRGVGAPALGADTAAVLAEHGNHATGGHDTEQARGHEQQPQFLL